MFSLNHNMPLQFYCRMCKVFLPKTDVKKRKLLDGSGDYRYYCPKCDSFLDRVCNDCAKGIMKIPWRHTSGDYNSDGYLDQFCTLCGHGFIKFEPYSKRKIKKTVDLLFTCNGLPYHKKRELLKELYTKCKSENDALQFLSNRFANSDGLQRL